MTIAHESEQICELEYRKNIEALPQEFVDVREALLSLPHISLLGGEFQSQIPKEINTIQNNVFLILGNSVKCGWKEDYKSNCNRRNITTIHRHPTEIFETRGFFINKEGQKGHLNIVFIDGKPYSEAFWLKRLEDDGCRTFELHSLVAPNGLVLKLEDAVTNSNEKEIKMPGLSSTIPLRMYCDF